MFNESDVISKYTRAEAIEDNVLIDISKIASEAGFKYPVAITQGIYSVLNNLEIMGQDYSGRAFDMFTILKLSIKKQSGDTIFFAPVFAKKAKNGRPVIRPVKMWSRCHGDDKGKPCITIMMPDED